MVLIIFLLVTGITLIPVNQTFIIVRLIFWLVYRILVLTLLIFLLVMTEQYMIDLEEITDLSMKRPRIVVYSLFFVLLVAYFGNISLYLYATMRQTHCTELFHRIFEVLFWVDHFSLLLKSLFILAVTRMLSKDLQMVEIREEEEAKEGRTVGTMSFNFG